jgi:hypothetical protein
MLARWKKIPPIDTVASNLVLNVARLENAGVYQCLRVVYQGCHDSRRFRMIQIASLRQNDYPREGPSLLQTLILGQLKPH